MIRTSRHRLAAAALVAALVLSGCDIVGSPIPVKPAENVGVDPTGETVDTSTLPPEAPEPEPAVAAAPSQQTAPRYEPAVVPSDAPPVLERSRVPAAAGGAAAARVGAGGMVHHTRKHSHDYGQDPGSGSGSDESGE